MIGHLQPLLGVLTDPGEIMTLHDALAGDGVAVCAVLDLIEEREEFMNLNPFVVGQCVYIESLSLFHIGKVVEVTPLWIKLDKCTLILRTGRKSVLFKNRSVNKKHFEQENKKPVTEYIGDGKIFMLQSLTMIDISWEESELPTK